MNEENQDGYYAIIPATVLFNENLKAYVSIPPKMSTVGNNKTSVYNYVANQLKEDMLSDQMTIKEYKDPFKG